MKVRGYRIELGEIEAALLRTLDGVATPRVARTCTATGGWSRTSSAPAALDVAAVRARLGERLPAYMVPAAFVPLAALPLTVNGKLDRAALPAPTGERAAPVAVDAAESATQRVLRELVAEVVGLSEVGADEDFFTVGGDSIIAIQLANRARRAGLSITPRDVFVHRTAAALAAVAAPSEVAAVGARPVGARAAGAGRRRRRGLARRGLRRCG